MKSFRAEGDVVKVTLGGTVASGDVVILEGGIGVYAEAGVSGDVVNAAVEGVFELAKVTSQAQSAGDRLFWDGSALTKTEAANTQAGICYEDAASADVLVKVKLLPSAVGQAANVAAVATADATDLATSEALANQLKTSLNAALAALKAAGLMKNA